MGYRLKFLFIALMVGLVSQAQIKVDTSGRFLREADGKPFFWLGDTGWELFHRLTRDEAVEYLDTRARQGYNVIQAVVLAEVNGVLEPNRHGDVPFVDADPTHWATTLGCNFNDPAEYDYWDNVDYLIKEAAKRNLYMGLLPAWGDKVTPGWGDGPLLFTDSNDHAYQFARRLAERYQNQGNIIWILGGDRPVVYDREIDGRMQHFDVRGPWRQMAKAFREVQGNDVFLAYHPGGVNDGTHTMWPNEEWLSIHAFQSGHGSRTVDAWGEARRSLAAEPHKPVLDIEPAYEDHPVFPWDNKWTREGRGFFSDYDVRARIYRSVLIGNAGITYGHHGIWQFLDTTRHPPIWFGDTVIQWRQALQAPAGAKQMKYLRDLMESRQDWNTYEDSLLIASERGTDYTDLIIANRNKSGTQVMIYLPQANPVRVDLNRMAPGAKTARWFNPATGIYTPISQKINKGTKTFRPPAGNRDWVLLIDQH